MINKTINTNLPDEVSTSVSLFLPQLNQTIIARHEKTILEILNENNIAIYAPCGGQGICGKCRVIIHGDINPLSIAEKEILSADEIKQGIRLACETYIYSAAEVKLLSTSLRNHTKEVISSQSQYPSNSRISKQLINPEKPTLENSLSSTECITKKLNGKYFPFKIANKLSGINTLKPVTVTSYNNEIISIDNGDTTKYKYGVAIDIGTTTVACYLMDLNTGEQLSVQSIQNPQGGYGADVISRINYCLDFKTGTNTLTKCIRHALNKLIKFVADEAKIKKKYIYDCVIVGNTTMHHLFLGINPKTLSELPFNPVLRECISVQASDLGINTVNRNAKLTFLPNIGGFIGADTFGCVIEANLIEKFHECRILIDLGTNGEIILSSYKGIFACSTAAGPAFEGTNISCGMQAFDGAINSIRIDENITYKTIGGIPPTGICGSGLIDAVSELKKTGLLKKSGKLAEIEEIESEALRKRIISKGRRKKEIIIVPAEETKFNESITISQKDIREIQLAKAAIRAGINILLKSAGLNSDEIYEILLAGAFGNFISEKNALNISLFPEIDISNIISLGNAAGGGAKIFLCDKHYTKEKVNADFKKIKHIELSTHPDFQNEFVDNMFF
ncbi:MAG: ASKHA domain-containing protein [Victivallales bacterium]|nr:ASKHA domain-containing protein [Victivallales bacterium]MCF7889324.1 ASKHA domain-containing protein [Victivallales bacterium]